MTYRIHITARAEADILERIDFYAEKNPNYAKFLYSEIRQEIAGLSFFPERHKIGSYPNTRECLSVKNHVIVYSVDRIQKLISVLFVFSAKQDREHVMEI